MSRPVRVPLRTALAIGIVAGLSGCGVGYNRVLFVTKSNLGIDFDSQPPTADFAVGRVEGVIEPSFEGGKSLPVLASFRPESRGIFAGDVAQTFATGDAAQAMATLYGTKDPACLTAVNNPDQCYTQNGGLSGTVTLDNEPVLPEKQPLQKKDVRPVFFGTSTAFGMRVTWSGMGAGYPDGFHLGYRRKEFALAPVSQRQVIVSGRDPKYEVGVPSLLATIDISAEATTPEKTSLKWLQYFATGKPASTLALRQDVRRAMLRRMDPSFPPFLQAGLNPAKRRALANAYVDLQELAEKGDAEVQTYVDGLDGLAGLVPPTYEFNYYVLKSSEVPDETSSLDLVKSAAIGTPVPAEEAGWQRLFEYWTQLDSSIEDVTEVIDDQTGTVKIEGQSRSDVLVTQLRGEREDMKQLKEKLESSIKSKDIVERAFYYWLTQSGS